MELLKKSPACCTVVVEGHVYQGHLLSIHYVLFHTPSTVYGRAPAAAACLGLSWCLESLRGQAGNRTGASVTGVWRTL
jgi:hypothetical protein